MSLHNLVLESSEVFSDESMPSTQASSGRSFHCSILGQIGISGQLARAEDYYFFNKTG